MHFIYLFNFNDIFLLHLFFFTKQHMLPRLFLFRKPDRLTTSLAPPKWHNHCSSISATNNSSFNFARYAAFGLTVFSLSTLYVLNRNSKVNASAIAKDEKHESKNKLQCPEWNVYWDNRRINAPNNSTRSYTLIRHGQYVHNTFECNKVLTDLGQKQAKITGETLKCFGTEYDEIMCSTMVRAKQTANIITKELFPNLTKEQIGIDIKYDPILNEGAPSYCIPEREDLNESGFWHKLDSESDRIGKAFETYIHRNDAEKDKEILIIGHGNVFRYFMCRVLQIPSECWLRFSICNCGITKFKVSADGQVSVQCIGSQGHLAKNDLTFN